MPSPTPPYINSGDIDGLQSEVKNYEPMLALDGGKDGLDFYRHIAKRVVNYLKPNGTILLECGIGQAEEIKEIFSSLGEVEIIKDYENIDRIIKVVLNV